MLVSTSVIVTTYNKPHELELVLCGLSLQKKTPLEILVADDGSTQDITTVIEKWREKIKLPIKHIWHEDIGNRKLKICNKAAEEATGNYLLFLDGDSVPHPFWVKDHVDAAKDGFVLCGRRVRLGPKISQTIDIPFIESGKMEKIAGPILLSALSKDTKRFLLGIRLPKWLARCFHPTERRLMGANFSLHKSLFKSVGGYLDNDEGIYETNERRREDAQLEILLLKSGVRRYPLINRAVVYHLYHPERPPNKTLNEVLEKSYRSVLQDRKLNKTQSLFQLGQPDQPVKKSYLE